MAFMEKDGFRLYYEDTGGNGPVVLFLHGAGGNHLSWWQQVPVFAEEYRCVTVDQRGFGQSPDTPGGPGPAALATDLLVRQRRTFEPAKRREIIRELQRYLAKQQYYVQLASTVYIAVWDGALKNYGPNLGYDYGGRLMAAWLDR